MTQSDQRQDAGPGTGFLYSIYHGIQARSGMVRRNLNRVFYNYLGRLDNTGDVRLMNYGYVPSDPNTDPLELAESDAEDRNCIQLYHAVAGAVDLTGKDVLEIGSGRGGGASFVKRCLSPRTMTGLDYAHKSIEFCGEHYSGIEDLEFVQGDAEDLPFAPASFDVVVNVESSHCYGDMDGFLRGVFRVLRPGGYFLWADHRERHEVDEVVSQIGSAGFELVDRIDITPNILASLSMTNERTQALINRRVPAPFRKIFHSFSGAEGTVIHDQLSTGELVYQRVAAIRPAGGSTLAPDLAV